MRNLAQLLRRHASPSVLIALMGGLAQIPAALAAPVSPATNPIVVLAIKGEVEVLKAGATDWTEASTKPPYHLLRPGDQLRTLAYSHATVRLSDLTIEQLDAFSHLQVSAETNRPGGLQLFRGNFFFLHRDQPGTVPFRSPTLSGAILGTEFHVQVTADGTTTVHLFDGAVELANESGRLHLRSGEAGVAAPGDKPRPTAHLEAVNVIQWRLYYPAVLDLDELALPPAAQQALGGSLDSYRSGDVFQALARYPVGRDPASNEERLYLAALLLAVGQVTRTEELLDFPATPDGRTRQLAAALRTLIAAVKFQTNTPPNVGPLATSLLAASYEEQSRARLAEALLVARQAVEQSTNFGFGWARLADLEFSHGQTDRALAALGHSLRLAPRNAAARALEGFVLGAQNRITEATARFEQAIELDPGLANGWLGRGLCRIRRGHVEEGRRDLQVAAAMEPQRAGLRSYLGKAFSEEGDPERAFHELSLAKQLDPRDPTPWLYLALLHQQHNRINPAVRDLERSQELNENRRVYRSRLLLDQDRAVRGANLASVYKDAGMTDVSVREAARAVNTDYANYSAHLFLANSFDALRDVRQVSQRYETPWLNEYLLANLLAPVGAGPLSPYVSQQEYSKLFERDRLGFASETEYWSRGDWVQQAAQFGTFGNSSYAIDLSYRSENGERKNSDLEQFSTFVRFKQQLTPKDSVFVQGVYYDAEAGDLAPYYDDRSARTGLRVKESQEPILLAGYHREWSPESHTLFLAGRLQDTLSFTNPAHEVLLLRRRTNGVVIGLPVTGLPVAPVDYRNEFEAYIGELQQIWKAGGNTLIAGARFQIGEFDTRYAQGPSTDADIGNTNGVTARLGSDPVADRHVTDFRRFSAYGYYHLQVTEPLLLVAGLAYDQVHAPANFRLPPVSDDEQSHSQLSPKAGLIWTPARRTTIRAAYTRSLGGAGFDQSFQIEPAQVAGFTQTYRSLAPEAEVGSLTAPRMETTGLSLEQKVGSDTYLGAQAEWLRSESDRFIGAVNAVISQPVPGQIAVVESVADTPQKLDYDERTLLLTLNQLVGENWAFGARYRLSRAELGRDLVEVPDSVSTEARTRTSATLHQLNLLALYQHESGFFGQCESIWSAQENRGYAGGLPGDAFWQFNVAAGYRLPQRRAEVRLALLNLTDQDYHLNPLNLTTRLPRERTLVLSLKFNF